MGKLEYLDALKRAMAGLAPAIQAKTLAYYEQRFVDGVAAGRTEEAVAQEAGDPTKIAMTLRASTHMDAFAQQKNPANLLRMLVSVVGLAIFNLFMVVPALVFGALLMALFACALGFYTAGIAVTASGLSGANELVLDGPLRHIVIGDDHYDDSDGMQTKVSISEKGVHFYQERRPQPVPAPSPAPDPASDADADAEAEADAEADGGAAVRTPGQVIRRAEAVAGQGIRITTDTDSGSRTTQTIFGLGMVLGGIALFLLGLVVSKYTLIGIRRYVAMNMSLIRGH